MTWLSPPSRRHRSRPSGGSAGGLAGAMAPGGSTDTSSMLWELLARPSQLSLLLRLAADAYALGPGFSWD